MGLAEEVRCIDTELSDAAAQVSMGAAVLSLAEVAQHAAMDVEAATASLNISRVYFT